MRALAITLTLFATSLVACADTQGSPPASVASGESATSARLETFTSDAAGFDTHLAERTAEYTQTMLEALKSFPDSNNKNYKEYVATVERAQGKFEMAMSGDDVKAMKETMLGLMDSLRTAVKAGGASDAAGRKVDAQYRMLRDDLT